MNTHRQVFKKLGLATLLSCCYAGVMASPVLSLSVTPPHQTGFLGDNGTFSYVVTLTNTAKLPLLLKTYTAPTGTLGARLLQSSCPFGSQTQALGVGQRCTATFLAATPAKLGHYQDTWQITDGAGLRHTIGWQATVKPQPALTLTSIETFPDTIEQNSDYEIHYQLTNQSGSTLKHYTINWLDNKTGQSLVGATKNPQLPDSCFDRQGQPRALANNNTCLIAYHYTPRTLGLLSTQLQVVSGGSTQVSQPITTTVQAPKGLQVTYLPTEASDWSGITNVNTPLNVCFEYHNAGTSSTPLTLSHTGANM